MILDCMYIHYSRRRRRRRSLRSEQMIHLLDCAWHVPVTLSLSGRDGDMEESGLPQQWTDPWLRGRSKASGKEQSKKRKRKGERAEVGWLLYHAQCPVSICTCRHTAAQQRRRKRRKKRKSM